MTARVSCQISVVVWANGAFLSTPAAQTSAAGGPAVAKSRSTSPGLLTSVGTGVASPPTSRIRAATDSSVLRSRAAIATCAPVAAIASAVAAPIPRLAPVTTAMRPASHAVAQPRAREPRFS